MNTQLQKAMNIVNQTGDRLIIVDNNSDNSYVVMNLDEYERLITKEKQGVSGLTEEKLLDKINRDIALWKNQHDDEIQDDYWSNSYEDDEDESENFYNQSISNFDLNKKKRKRWRIPKNIKEEAEEVDDDTQYLEKIPF